MILQRLATSIRKQDWFTVLIETLIVVPNDIDIHPLQGRKTP
ncbi:hypothetical protein WNY37_16900 [Henriciella sp. AS95]